ncbi:fructose bisphosphate aldolase [Demequina zhanjiangensis]|uniref:fructose-bisphosphate aldolase n=1 Tax=Demequina zhanjiangensis TaxID=3051659 RepID=A0ABT8FXM5_9MICO|nr:fructose bisphosphate aldolase [Demequina sp. SYSU T00b26]MDN4471656.1 fructose bisphosphate aldolase [Demequina sp. SYSU T00b26]
MFTSPQLTRFETEAGFIAALDQSGGSTPGALARYGIDESAYASEDEMFDLVHAMRTRVITDPAFSSDRILGTILFQGTVDREIEGKGVADYVWSVKGVLPFLKIDKGLEEERRGVRMMKDIPSLEATLAAAKAKGVFGTKERSVIRAADAEGIGEIAVQQFALGRRVLEAGLMPILEPEIDIRIPDKEEAEYLLEAELRAHLDDLGDAKVALKLTLPTRPGLYDDVVAHPNVARVVALSGGYTRDEANALLARNHGMIASFSRALLEGLRVEQTDDEFHSMLDVSIESIFQASKT